MAVKRRNPSQFNLSFLDIMCCGFGAVVLLVMLLNGDMLASREQVVDDLRAEVMRLEREVRAGREYLVTLQNSMLQTDDELVRTVGLSRQVLDSLTFFVEFEQVSLQRIDMFTQGLTLALQSGQFATGPGQRIKDLA